MAATQPMAGPGRFQWSSGGWFGSQLGSTAWLLVGAALLAPQAFWITVLWLMSFALANAIGTWLWWRRDRLPPFLALQLLLVVCAGSGLLALLALDFFGPADVLLDLIWQNGHVRMVELPVNTLRSAYVFLLLFVPAGLGYFALLEWGARKTKSGSPT